MNARAAVPVRVGTLTRTLCGSACQRAGSVAGSGGEHSTTNCVGICSWCHDLIHYHHYTLEPNGDGTYHLRAPPESVIGTLNEGLAVARPVAGWVARMLPSRILGGPRAPNEVPVSKKTKKRKLKARRNKANHGRKPNAGR